MWRVSYSMAAAYLLKQEVYHFDTFISKLSGWYVNVYFIVSVAQVKKNKVKSVSHMPAWVRTWCYFTLRFGLMLIT